MSITFLFCLIVGRLVYLQLIVGGEITSRAAGQWSRDLPLFAERGLITDLYGEVLADSRTVYNVYVRPNAVTDKEGTANALSLVLGINADIVHEKICQRKSEITLARNVEREIADKIQNQNLRGVYLATAYKRTYPHGNMLSKVIGFTNVDGVGQNGLEGYYDKYLSGNDGYLYVNTDLIGRQIDDSIRYVPSRRGCNAKLSIDYEIQSFAESAVIAGNLEWKSKSCSAIVMDVNTGGIRAMASYPSYDLNAVPRNNIDLLNSLSKNSLITDVYEPGSTFKIFTTAASLSYGVANENSRYYCNGSHTVDGTRIKCWRTIGHGSQSLAEGVQNSCNVVFMNLALSMGVDRFYEKLQDFGFGSKTGIDFFGESSGIMMKKDNVKNVDLARIGFGQAVAVTPVQLASGVCAAINGGTLYEPYFLESLEDDNGHILYSHEKTVRANPITPEVSERLRKLLVGVVEGGGGSRASVEGIRIGGKTGTAQKYENGKIAQGKYVSSFVGFAPADNPKYVVLYIVDEPSGYTYYGSLTAAPYAGQIFSRIADYEGWMREDKETVWIEMPDVINLDMTQAVKTVEAVGLKVETVGSGKVLSSTPSQGERVKRGDVILLRGEDISEDTS